MKRKTWLLLALTLLAVLALSCAQAQEAEELTSQCTFSAAYRSKLFRLTDGKLNMPFEVPAKYDMWVEGQLPEDSPACGMYLTWTSEPTPSKLEVWNGTDFEPYATCGDRGMSHEYVTLPGTCRFRLSPLEGTVMNITEVRLLSQGELPAWVQNWQPSPEKADLLLLVAHPDDEYIFFGGLIPYYAVERQLHVSVCYLTFSCERRLHELLDGLWTAGLREYPTVLSFKDRFTRTLDKGFALWGRDNVLDAVANVIDTLQPEVVAAHDLQGEYGHGAHRVAGATMLALIRDHERELTWQPKKLYLHLWEEGELMMDWETPSEALGGRTSLEVAQEAFKCHKSQQGFSCTMKNGVKYMFQVVPHDMFDNAKFGLAYSTVGEDEAHNDLMEHISPQTQGGL